MLTRSTAMSRSPLRKAAFDYIAVGHVTIDVLQAGTAEVQQLGGSAFYSALQASRLGLRTLVLTQGNPRQIEALLAPYAGELELHVLPAPQTTMLQTLGSSSRRMQHLRAWAGPIDGAQVCVRAQILHIAPVARETPSRWPAHARFIGLTPQGLMRRWPPGGGQMELACLTEMDMPRRCDAVVISDAELAYCDALLPGGAVIAVTAGEGPTEVRPVKGGATMVAPMPVTGPQDDIGAGDVFAAAFFVALHEGMRPPRAAAFANSAATIRIGGKGACAIGDRAAIERRLTATMG